MNPDSPLRLVVSNPACVPDADPSFQQDRRRLVTLAEPGQSPMPNRSPGKPLEIRCPFCEAGAGSPCKVAGRHRYGFVHPARAEAAQNPNPAPAPPSLTKDWP